MEGSFERNRQSLPRNVEDAQREMDAALAEATGDADLSGTNAQDVRPDAINAGVRGGGPQDPASRGLANEEIQARRAHLLQSIGGLEQQFPNQAKRLKQSLARVKTPEGFARLEGEIRESYPPPQETSPAQQVQNVGNEPPNYIIQGDTVTVRNPDGSVRLVTNSAERISAIRADLSRRLLGDQYADNPPQFARPQQEPQPAAGAGAGEGGENLPPPPPPEATARPAPEPGERPPYVEIDPRHVRRIPEGAPRQPRTWAEGAPAPMGSAGETGERRRQDVVPDRHAPPRLGRGVHEIRQREIQADPEMEKNFLLVVERLDPIRGAEIYAKAASGGVIESERDLALLAHARVEFANRRAAGLALQKRLEGAEGIANLGLAKNRNPHLRHEVELDSDVEVQKYMTKQAMVLAMKMNPAMIEGTLDAFEDVAQRRGTRAHKNLEWIKKQLLTLSKVSPQEYDDVYKLNSKQERKETVLEIRDRIREGRGFLWRTFDRLNLQYIPKTIFEEGKTRSEVKAEWIVKEAAKRERLDKKIWNTAELEEAQDRIVKFMKLTFTDDPEARRAFQQSAFANEEVVAVETRPPTLREMRGERARLVGNAALSPGNLKERFTQDMESGGEEIEGRRFAQWTAEEKSRRFKAWQPPSETIGRLHNNGLGAQQERRSGFLTSFLDFLLGLILGKQKQQVNFAQ